MHALLIEDQPRDVELARVALGRSGLGVGLVAVPDEGAAIDYLLRRGVYAGRQAEGPVVIFLDLVLAEARGSDLIAAIRSNPALSWIPIVMWTTSHRESDIEECYRRGANAYMVKPIDFGEFVDRFQHAVRFWAEINVRIDPAVE